MSKMTQNGISVCHSPTPTPPLMHLHSNFDCFHPTRGLYMCQGMHNIAKNTPECMYLDINVYLWVILGFIYWSQHLFTHFLVSTLSMSQISNHIDIKSSCRVRPMNFVTTERHTRHWGPFFVCTWVCVCVRLKNLHHGPEIFITEAFFDWNFC